MSVENAAVNWSELMKDYNSVKGTTYKTAKEMLRAVYAEKQTYKKTGKVFLLTCPTIAKYMFRWGLPCLPSGHRGESPCLKAIRELEDVAGLTVKQIAKQTGFSQSRINFLVKKHEIKYRKLRDYRI